MLNSLKQQYLAEKNARAQAFTDQLRQLNVFTSDQMSAWNDFYDRMRDELEAFIEDMTEEDVTVPNTSTSSSSSAGGQSKAGRASGGYASYGRYWLGERGEEFVLSSSTTQAAERLVGNRLNQQNVLGALGGSGTMIVNLNLPGGRMSIRDRQAIITQSRDAALNGLAQALDMVNR
jgi:hypothetical protein